MSAFVAVWRSLLTVSDYQVGCSVLATTVSADDADIIEHAADVFRSREGQLASVLAEGSAESAEDLGTLLVASCEGAVVLCRAIAPA